MIPRALMILLVAMLLPASLFAHGDEAASHQFDVIQFGDDEDFTTVEITARNWSFDVDGEHIQSGDKVRLLFSVEEGHHGIAIPKIGVKTGNVLTGETVTIDFVAEAAGEFAYHCNIFCGRGHATMRETLEVGAH